MASFYRVANGNWNLANSWATTSGGTTYHASPPTSSDDVYFDSSTPTGTHTLNVAGNCNNIDFTGFTGTYNTANALNVYGNMIFFSGMTASVNHYILIYGTGTHTITSGTKSLPIRIYGSGNFTMQDDFKGEFNIEGTSNATVDFNDFNFSPTTATFFQVKSGVGTPTLYLRSGTFTNTHFNFSNTNLILVEGTSTINFFVNGSFGKTFTGGGFTFNNISLTKNPTSSTGTHTISGSNTFNQFSVDTPSSVVRFTDGTTQTISSLVAEGTSSDIITLQGTSTGGWTISDLSGNNVVDYCDIQYSTATGGALWIAKNSTDSGNNTGWNFVEGFLSVPTGSYTYTGVNFLLKRLYQLAINTGNYTYTGFNWLMKKVYVMLMSAGTYTYTGFNWLYGFPLRVLRATTGSYSYTGFNLGLLKTFRIAINTGVYTYTGFINRLTKVFRLVINTGSYIYTGVNWSMGRAYRILIETGVYVYRGFAFWKWKNTAKTVSNWVNGIKSSSVWSNNNKSSSTWSKSSKSNSTWSNSNKNSNDWTNQNKN